MNKYTLEQVELAASRLECHAGLGHATRSEWSKMLFDYAALLRERESAKAGVTDKIIAGYVERVACVLSGAPFPSARSYAKAREISDLMLEAVAPMLTSARVPEEMKIPKLGPDQEACDGFVYEYGFSEGFNACRVAMLTAPKPEKE